MNRLGRQVGNLLHKVNIQMCDLLKCKTYRSNLSHYFSTVGELQYLAIVLIVIFHNGRITVRSIHMMNCNLYKQYIDLSMHFLADQSHRLD